MKASIKVLHSRVVTFVFDLDWQNEHVRYLAVAVLSGALNIITYTVLSLKSDLDDVRWYAVVVGGTVGYFGHKIVSYGYGEQFSWWMIPKFVFGMISGAGVYWMITKGFTSLPWHIPYIYIHVAAMFIGFLFFQQWNLRVTFKTVVDSESPDHPVVISVELSDE